MLPLRTILHPTDFSKHSEFAFEVAAALARDYNASLILLHVIPPPMVVYTGNCVPAEMWPNVEEIKENLRNLEKRTSRIPVESLIREGDPVEVILRVAKETHSDVIIMGTHGRTALCRLLLGSVAEAVICKAPCPVLTAKPMLRQKKILEESETEKESDIAATIPVK